MGKIVYSKRMSHVDAVGHTKQAEFNDAVILHLPLSENECTVV